MEVETHDDLESLFQLREQSPAEVERIKNVIQMLADGFASCASSVDRFAEYVSQVKETSSMALIAKEDELRELRHRIVVREGELRHLRSCLDQIRKELTTESPVDSYDIKPKLPEKRIEDAKHIAEVALKGNI